jgi:hypothetical protein
VLGRGLGRHEGGGVVRRGEIQKRVPGLQYIVI